MLQSPLVEEDRVRGDKYNEEESLKLFRVPHDCFNALVRLLKHHAAFLKHGMKQRKHFSFWF